MLKNKYDKWFVFLISCQLIIWTITPTFLLQNTYVDILENIMWGKHFAWGYDKNPPVAAIISYLSYSIMGRQVFICYFLSQLSIVICYFAVYQLAKQMLSVQSAFVSVTLLVGIGFFNHSSPEFNDDILELSLWALSVLFFYKAIKTQHLKYWIFTAVFCALSFLTKYFTAILLLTMLLFSFFNKEARKSYLSLNIYLSIMVFILLITPNIAWLIQHDFVTLQYAVNRADLTHETSRNFLSHLIHPFSFLWSMLGVILPSIILSMLFLKEKRTSTLTEFNQEFLNFFTFGPLLLTTLFSFMTGANLHYTWATPLFSLIGIFLIANLNPDYSERSLRRYFFSVSTIFFIWWIIYCCSTMLTPYLTQKGGHEHFPGRTMSNVITKDWNDFYHTPLIYVMGARELALNLSVYAPNAREVLIDWDLTKSPWIDIKDLKRKGGIMLWPAAIPCPPDIKEYFKLCSQVKFYTFDWAVSNLPKRFFSSYKMEKVVIMVGFMQPNLS